MMPMAVHRWRALVALVLVLLSGPVLALGLGEIRVKSAPGQPLLAEIPIISSEPGELEQLRAQLASPATFERVGLPRPQGLVGDLDFAIALDDAGRPVIRVSSQAPVDVPVVNFLIEVDWGQGRLVREYSAMVDSPGTVAAAVQPAIEAPSVAPVDVITRPSEPVAAEPEPAPAGSGTGSAPAAVAAAPPPAAVSGGGSGDTWSVARGQTLSQIAAGLGSGYGLDQTMIALLRANPEAFIGGNINRLKQGAVLRIPARTEIAQLGEGEASALVRRQIDDWRQVRRPIPQPVALAAPAGDAAAAPPSDRAAEARLEIAPPLASAAARAGTQSGIDAGGEGDMLANPQLQQSREDLAARESEVQELRAQVAELEKLKQQQDKLIAMKDSDLAAAQQRLAQSNGGEAGVPAWAWAGWALLILGALAWLWTHRHRRLQPAAPKARTPIFPSAPAAAKIEPVEPAAVATPVPQPVETVEAAPAPVLASPAPGKPTWHSGDAAASIAPLNAAPAGRERLELAIAYLDLGDTVTARDLLNEVASGNDAVARQEALQLLRDLG